MKIIRTIMAKSKNQVILKSDFKGEKNQQRKKVELVKDMPNGHG